MKTHSLVGLLLAACLLCACERPASTAALNRPVPASQTAPIPTLTPPASEPLPASMKGYGLFSWQQDGAWHFTLITATNRLQTIEEITAPEDELRGDGWVKLSATGQDALLTLLARLPQNTEVFWGGWTVDGQSSSGPLLTYPPAEILQAVQAFCDEHGLTLHTAPQE